MALRSDSAHTQHSDPFRVASGTERILEIVMSSQPVRVTVGPLNGFGGISVVRYLNIALLWLGSFGLAAIFVRLGAHGTFGQDSHAYWLAFQDGELYGSRPAELDAYLYSPLFAQLLTPFGWLSWPVFRLVWLVAGVAATLWLVKPLPVRWAVPGALFAVSDLVIGNVYVFLGVMVALGARSGLPWLFGLLTKVTPGVGLLWLLARGEYRAVARAAAVLVVLVSVSYAVDPAAWVGWLQLLTSGTGGDPTLYPRCAVAVALAVWGARRSPAWLAVAVVAATPVFNAAACLVPLLAVPRLLEQTRRSEVPPTPMSARVGARVLAMSAARSERGANTVEYGMMFALGLGLLLYFDVIEAGLEAVYAGLQGNVDAWE